VARNSQHGDIAMRDLDGYARCETVDGGIRLERLRGEASTRTVDGRIEARDLQARIKGHTVDGDIVLEWVAGGVDLKTTDGKISASDLDGWGEGIFLATVDGSIRVKLGQATGQLDAMTGEVLALANVPSYTPADRHNLTAVVTNTTTPG